MSDWELRNLEKRWVSSGLREDYDIYYNYCLRSGLMPQCFWCKQLAEVQCWSCDLYVCNNCATCCICGSCSCPDHHVSCDGNTDDCFALCGNLDEHLTTDTEYVHVCTVCNSLLCENCTVYCELCAESGFGSIGAELCEVCAKTCAACGNIFHDTNCLDNHQCEGDNADEENDGDYWELQSL